MNTTQKSLCTAALLLTTAAPALAGGLSRSDQSIGILFEKSANYVELSYGKVMPDVTGNAQTGPISNVAADHTLPGLAYKTDVNDKVSLAFTYDNAYGADIAYDGNPAATVLGGTQAEVNSQGFTFLGRYKFDDNWSMHGGFRASKADASVTLAGLGYGQLSGYNATLDSDWGFGYLIGGAYERPEIALRVALTYQSKTTHEFPTVERMGTNVMAAGDTKVTTPEAVTLDFQTGVAADTLVFGSLRWEHWTQMKTQPTFFNAATSGSNLTDLSNSTTLTLGVGRKFTENWSGSVFATYEKSGGGDEVSPLAPTNGYKGIGVAAIYTQDNIKVTAGLRYMKLGNAWATTAQPVAEMRGNDAWAAGLKVGYSF
ncbi:MAG: outer membrane protein transport protein [Paracoccus sp. (in: a-proteobacteria)]|uniref:OmpP1/FadL family transporter n=1 Tax=Paracoccus sp. TaxID=267 RepID=UPI0026E0D7EF|nr:outer membrane protein transport protein [Paracoccus sp. (in: a-proteobacteria)]MDO5621064.1 outer membrane protein transport protein [Paracoccus sp. (in: a-proteobacteria)]